MTTLENRPRSALLVIDAQESFRQRTEEWAATANPRVLHNIAMLVDRARQVRLLLDSQHILQGNDRER